MNIYVGNLDFKTTEDELRRLFQGYGQVERVNLVRAGDTGQLRGFAFVEMNNNGEAERAIAGVNGSNLGGRTLNVNQARPKTSEGAVAVKVAGAPRVEEASAAVAVTATDTCVRLFVCGQYPVRARVMRDSEGGE